MKILKKISYLFVILLLFFISCDVYALEKHYDIDDYNVKVAVSTEYDVIIKVEGNDNSLIYNKLGLDKDQIENYMETLNAYFLATTPDLKKNIILTRKQDEGSEKYYNLTEIDEDVVDSLAQGYVEGASKQGANANDYSIEKANGITYIKFKYDMISAQNEHLYYLKYKTIYNGYDYTVYIQKYSNITSEDESELQKVIENFEIEEIENPNKVSNIYTTPLWLAILFGIGYAVWCVYKKSKKDKSNNTKPIKNEKLDKPDKVYKCSKCGETFDHDFEICPKCKFNFSTNEEAVEDIESDNSFTCDNCGAIVSEDAEECPKCGCVFVDEDSNEEQFVCDNCGSLVNSSAKKCPNCGEKFDEEEDVKEEKTNKSKDKEKKKESDMDKKYSDLNKLKKLLDNKIITKEEFEKEKKKILNK